ncbi:hypothetical protein [Fibrobacter sp. UWH4]|uniref:hypothetical protein n=1 Tax=Fibrobacter sp. UWH4 TaxID=1896210 RepID=UPI00091B7F75|nr:hypothetical protein [Fibrobacter sp. UWH4]SHL06656.1 hypothetical protein SAMN05720762_10498 [Fibrobacter sp. UWH4]
MEKGQWLRITHMDGEPQYSGKIGKVEHVDDAGHIHGTWGGCAIIPKTDSYELLTDEQAEAIIAEEKRKADEYVPPYVENARKVEVPFVAVRALSRLERLNGVQAKQYECKVVLDLNGCYEMNKNIEADGYRGRKWLVCGVPDNMCARIYDRIRRNIGQDCCPKCLVTPCDLRKSEDDYLPAIDQACELAMKVV